MALYEIPTVPAPQTFLINLGGVEYRFRLLYLEAIDDQGGWVLDVLTAEGVKLICGVPLVTGADLLSQYSYLGINGRLIVYTDGDATAVPTFATMGSTSRLYFATEDA